MSKIKFFRCDICGNIVGLIIDAGIPMVCCGEEMTELIPSTTDGAYEKHLPVVEIKDNEIKVSVGGVPHPMVKEHYIQWIYVETEKGGQRKSLLPDQKPEASFMLVDDKAIAVYEYCNLHGLWKTDIK